MVKTLVSNKGVAQGEARKAVALLRSEKIPFTLCNYFEVLLLQCYFIHAFS